MPTVDISFSLWYNALKNGETERGKMKKGLIAVAIALAAVIILTSVLIRFRERPGQTPPGADEEGEFFDPNAFKWDVLELEISL